MNTDSRIKKVATDLTIAVETGDMWWLKIERLPNEVERAKELDRLKADSIIQTAQAYLDLYAQAVESGHRSHTGLGWAIRRVSSLLRLPIYFVESLVTMPPPKQPTAILRVSIDPALKREAFTKVVRNGVTKRAVIEAGLRAWLAGELKVSKGE